MYWDGTANQVIGTLYELDNQENVYQGTYSGNKVEFEIVDGNTWYGRNPTDNSKLSSEDDKWKFWIDGGETINVTITVNLNNMTWSYIDNAN